jgi:hypothetical protein
MADRVLFRTWSAVVRGREERALEVFQENLAFAAELERQGRIERFETVLLGPNGSIGGFFLAYGSHAQLDALREDDRYRRLTVESQLIVDDLTEYEGFTGQGLQTPLGHYGEAVAALGHAATA